MNSIDPRDAALALSDVDAISRRVKQSLIYRGSSLIMMLWGVLVACGYTVNMLWPWHAESGWNLIYIVGTAGTVAIVAGQRKTAAGRAFDLRLLLAYVFFFGFGILWTAWLAHFTPRQLGAFWATYFMLGYVLVGLWVAYAVWMLARFVTLTLRSRSARWLVTGALR